MLKPFIKFNQLTDGEKMITKLKENKRYLIFFIAATILAFLFPLTGDDYTWVTSDGISLMKSNFVDYNGRYLGNLSAIIFTRLDIIRPILKGFTITAIIYLIHKITKNTTKEYFYLTGALMLFPSMLLVQGLVWTAGFANYTLSALIIMFCLYILFYKEKKNAFDIILLIVLGIAGQLFMETYTLFAVAMAVIAIIHFAVKNKKADMPSIVYFIATIIGAVIMFSNSVYLKILRGEHNYQSLSGKRDSIFETLINQFFNLFSKVFSNMLIGCFPAIIIILIICFARMRKSNNKKAKTVCITVTVVSFIAALIFGVFTVLDALKHGAGSTSYKRFLGISAAFIYLPCIVMIATFFDKKTKQKVANCALMILFTSVPFCFIGPVGARCFMGAYILLMIMISHLYDFRTSKAVSTTIKAVFITIFALNTVCYSVATVSCYKKAQSAKQQVAEGKKVVELERTKFAFMLHAPDDEWHHLVARRFCEYNGLPEDTKFVFK